MLRQWLMKDIKILPVMLLFALFLPCVFCWVLGNLYIENVPFGLVNLDNSSLSRQITQGLEDHPGLDVIFVDNQQKLEDMIYKKEVYAGMIIPEDFSRELSAKHPKELLTIVDATNTLIANNVMAYVSTVTETYNAGAMLTLLEADGMPATAAMHTYNTFQYIDRTLYDPYLSYLSYLLYFIMPYLLQMTLACLFGLPMFSEMHQQIIHKGRKASPANLLAEVIVRFAVVYLLSAIASWAGFCLADYFFGLPVRGTMLLYFILLAAFEASLMAAAMILATFIKPRNCLYFFESYLVLGMVILLTSGAVWLPYLMPDGLFQIVGFIWPFAHAALPFKYLNLKGAGWDIIGPAVGNCLLYTVFWIAAALVITILQRKWYKNRHGDNIEEKDASNPTESSVV